MTVEMVASRLGITPRTLHYYEELGLLPDVGRTEGGHRVYSEDTVDRLEKILRLKETLGYSLKEIKRILEVEESLDKLRQTYRQENLNPQERVTILSQFEELLSGLVDRIDERIDRLTAMRDTYYTRLTKTQNMRKDIESNL